MAQTQTTSRKPRTTLHLPRTARNTAAAMKSAAPEPTPPRHDEPPRANESVWVTALSGAEAFHRDALQLELAVGLSVFSVKADAVKVGLDAKKALRNVYAKAGYNCVTPLGEDYKTVNRRINVAADLYQHIGGRETIMDWIGDAAPREQVKTIMEHVKGYHFDSINDVLAFMGKAVAVKRPREGTKPQEQQASEQQVADAAVAAISLRQMTTKLGLPQERIFQHGAMTIAVPLDASYDDVMACITDLTIFATTELRAKAPAAANEATPAAAPAQALVAA